MKVKFLKNFSISDGKYWYDFKKGQIVEVNDFIYNYLLSNNIDFVEFVEAEKLEEEVHEINKSHSNKFKKKIK